MMTTLPKSLASGEALEIQIAPIGDYPASMRMDGGEPERVMQRLDAAALGRVAAAFNAGRELLVDADHVSESGGSTEAYGWITALRFDAERGLMATVNWTGLGAEAVSDRRFRYVSPVFAVDVDEGGAHPTELLSLALTNQPNLPVSCVLNRAAAATSSKVEATQKDDTTMIAEKLGLAPDASEEQILAAIDALLQQVAAAEAAALNAEAACVADENKDKIENREGFLRLYVAHRDAARELLATVRASPEAPAAKVCNAAAAQAPAAPEDADSKLVAQYRAMKPGPDKDQYLAANRATLSRLMV